MNDILKKVFTWMFGGLLLTFATAYIVSCSENILYAVFATPLYWILPLIELGLVIILSARITKMSPTTARIMFLLYSFVTGLTFSIIFVAYEIPTLIYVFFTTALLFGIFAFIGAITKLDLRKMGTYLFVGLISVIITAIINIFVGNSTLDLAISIISIVIFLGFTAYDMKKIESLEGIIPEDNLPIYGALELYLDFINLFLDILRIIGGSRKD